MDYTKKDVKLLRISRFLTPENRVNLLGLIHLAHTAETSARKSPGIVNINGHFTFEQQEYSCGNIAQRSKK